MNLMLHKVISGGQTGADQAALWAAKQLGYRTGGWMPAGAQTDGGPNWFIAREFGMDIHEERGYPPRTERNVRVSDGTVIFGNPFSPGCRLTRNLCLKHHKPYIINPTVETLRHWLEVNRIGVLNVAGNRERSNPGIFDKTKAFLLVALAVGAYDERVNGRKTATN